VAVAPGAHAGAMAENEVDPDEVLTREVMSLSDDFLPICGLLALDALPPESFRTLVPPLPLAGPFWAFSFSLPLCRSGSSRSTGQMLPSAPIRMLTSSGSAHTVKSRGSAFPHAPRFAFPCAR
jgi:hypothetical protein